MAKPDWLSIEEISRLWGEETGLDASAFQKDLEQWFAEFVKQTPASQALITGKTTDTTNLLMGMLGARYLERQTFEAYCEERGYPKPRFWFGGRVDESRRDKPNQSEPAETEASRIASMARPSVPGPASPEAPWHGPKASPGPEQRGSESYGDPSGTNQLLRQMKARRKGRGRVILVAGLVVPLMALLFWGVETLILSAGKEPIAPLVETADPMADPGSAGGGQPPSQR